MSSSFSLKSFFFGLKEFGFYKVLTSDCPSADDYVESVLN